jgi:hypothetical protein
MQTHVERNRRSAPAAVGFSALLYGPDGAVPVSVVRMSVFGGFMLVEAVTSFAIPVQYAGGSRDTG